MTAKEDKKTSVFAKATPRQAARVGRVPGLILAQRWGRPSLAGGVLCVDSVHLRECCISFSMTSYKRCESLPNCEAVFIKRLYPIYYNVIPYLLGLNVGKTKKANSGLIFSKLMAY